MSNSFWSIFNCPPLSRKVGGAGSTGAVYVIRCDRWRYVLCVVSALLEFEQ